jgi:hypothetical protein
MVMKIKKQLVFILTAILSLTCYSQISFEKGHYIDNNNQKTNCLIKNIDWKNNPTEFEYKLSENSASKKVTIKSIKEFGIDNTSKYVRSIVNIDRSSENTNKLSNDKNPVFNEEELFLKVLVEGKSTLYQYIDGSLRRYFYNKENSNIEQLIFKIYKTTDNNNNNIGKNNRFKQQLWVNLKCPNFKISKIENIEYQKSSLVAFFTEYSECQNTELINFESKQKRDLFNLTVRPRINSSSLTIQNSASNAIDTDFENKTGFGCGLEVEFILPYNKNKWAIIIEPTYQSFKSKKTTNLNIVSGGVLIAEVNYNSIEIPVGLRHYLFLNNNSKIFINASLIFDSSSKSSIEYKRIDNSNINSFDIKTRPNLGIGLGYKQNDKYSLEMRYQTDRNVLSDYTAWKSEYKSLSIIFGYTLF